MENVKAIIWVNGTDGNPVVEQTITGDFIDGAYGDTVAEQTIQVDFNDGTQLVLTADSDLSKLSASVRTVCQTIFEN